MALSFIFDTSKGETPQSVARKRALAAAIMGQMGNRSAKNVGEGVGNALASIGNGISANVLNRRADKAETAGQESANPIKEAIRASLMGEASFPVAPGASPASSDPVPVDLSGDKQTFIQSLMPAALEASQRTGVDPRIIVAQAAQETGWGKSAPGNNFFGIKSHGQDGGQNLTTHEVINGQRVKVKDSFRQFASPGDSVAGYADFLLKNPRYKPMMQAEGLDAQLQALGASGYATDPNYAQSVGSIARGLPAPAAAANEAMATGQPVQTASLDPSIGMPEPGVTPGAPGAVTDAGQRVLSTMMNPQPMGGAPMPMNEINNFQNAGPVAQPRFLPMQGQPQQMAQASPSGPDLSQLPVMAGGNADAIPPGRQGQVPMEMLYQALSNPFVDEGTKSFAMMMLKQQLAQQDPSNALDSELKRAQIDAYKRKGGSLINAGNGNIYDPQTGSWLSAPTPDGEAPLFDGKSVQAQGLNYLVRTGELTREQAAQLAAGKTITDPSTGAITFMTPQGLVTQPSNGGSQDGQNGQGGGNIPLTGPKKPTDTEYATGIYADRMTNSGKIIDGLENAGTGLKDNVASGLPFGNYMISGDYQKFDQAQRDFVNAVLRRESGAVISPEEFDNARKQYLPQPGDSTEVLAQKRRNRLIAIQGMQRASGPSYAVPDAGNAGQNPTTPAAPKRLKFNPATGELE